MSVPNWPTQPWFSQIMRLLVDKPVILPRSKNLLRIPGQPETIHPLHKKTGASSMSYIGKSLQKQ